MPLDAVKEMQKAGKWRKVDVRAQLTPQEKQLLQDK